MSASDGLSGVVRLGGDPPSPYEDQIGFSRVVVAGPFVMVGGTTSVDQYGMVEGETPYEQTVVVMRKIAHELGRAGASLSDVVQARAYLTDISRVDEVGRAWSEAMRDVRPLLTGVQVAALIDPRMWVEIEVAAYRPD
ncbi:MAG TPA: Rid family hydrolase [Solirubrobacteraceae bacterium]|nr:Rid family hydrolase [Solirubrobacteraceae bacterium]